ncbi:MAG: hypothetical protein ACOC32_00390 [Nanoarchaeota archaeon]
MRECWIDDIIEEYDCFDSDRHDRVQGGIQRRIEEMRTGSLKELHKAYPEMGHRLILWNMCSFPEFYNPDVPKAKDRFSCVDPNPILAKYNLRRVQEGKNPVSTRLHAEVDTVLDFIAEGLIHSRFYKEAAQGALHSSSRAFFVDDDQIPQFRMKDYMQLIEREIESFTDKLVIDVAFKNEKTAKQQLDLEESVIRDLVDEAVKTYFARLEYNAAVNEAIHNETPEMVRKFYDKPLEDATDIERIVSQIFVAHDWVRDSKEAWMSHPDRMVSYDGQSLDTADYLTAGEQSLLFEIIPNQIQCKEKDRQTPYAFAPENMIDMNKSDALDGFFGGKTYRVIHEDADFLEANYVQAANLGDQIKEYTCTDIEKYMGIMKHVREQYTQRKKRRPTMIVHPKTDQAASCSS